MSSVSADKAHVNVTLFEDLNQVQDWHILLEHPCPSLKLHHILLACFLIFLSHWTQLHRKEDFVYSVPSMQTEGTAYISVNRENNNQCSLVGMNFHILSKDMEGPPHAEPHGALSSQFLDVTWRDCCNSKFGPWTVAIWLRLTPIGLYIWLLSYQALAPFEKNYNY